MQNTKNGKLAKLGSRRIHLDFHNSPVLKIGEKFDPNDFIKILQEANVDGITIFGKCTHGLCYYPTKIGKMHPGLDFDTILGFGLGPDADWIVVEGKGRPLEADLSGY